MKLAPMEPGREAARSTPPGDAWGTHRLLIDTEAKNEDLETLNAFTSSYPKQDDQ